MRHVPHEIASDLHLVARFATTTFISIVNELASDCAFFCSFSKSDKVLCKCNGQFCMPRRWAAAIHKAKWNLYQQTG